MIDLSFAIMLIISCGVSSVICSIIYFMLVFNNEKQYKNKGINDCSSGAAADDINNNKR